jgi:hypothetical protein
MSLLICLTVACNQLWRCIEIISYTQSKQLAIRHVLIDNNQKAIDNIPYPLISIYRPIIEQQYSNCIITRQCHVLCLIQQHRLYNTNKNMYALQFSVVQKKKKLYEMLIWSKEEKFSSKQDKI